MNAAVARIRAPKTTGQAASAYTHRELSPREALAWSCWIDRHVERRLVSAHSAGALAVIVALVVVALFLALGGAS